MLLLDARHFTAFQLKLSIPILQKQKKKKKELRYVKFKELTEGRA